MSTRRGFITLLGGAATWSWAARAQQTGIPLIGFLSTRAPGEDAYLLAAFHQGLKETGYAEGQNVAIEYRFAENQYDRLPALAADLVRKRVNVIAAPGGPSGPAAKAATATIPVVFSVGTDPVEAGLVASLNRPGGNVTGVASMGIELGPKRLELMHEMVPAATIIAALVNPSTPAVETQSRDMQETAGRLGLQIRVLNAGSDRDFDAVFATLPRLSAGGLVIGNDPFFSTRTELLAALALRHAVPAISQFREFAAAGGLMTYGGSLTDMHRQVGVYTGRILKGQKPADLPVQLTTKVELIINMKTVKALGLTVPLTLLGRADEVVE